MSSGVFDCAISAMSALESFCNYTLYSPLQTRISSTYSWMALLIVLQVTTAFVASYPLYFYYKLDQSRRAKLWLRFLPFFFLILIGAVAGAAGWACYMEYIVALQITTAFDTPPELYDAQPMSAWFRRSFRYLTAWHFFFSIEFPCFVVSKMFVLERLLTFGSSSMAQGSTTRARLIFKWISIVLSITLLAIIVVGWACAGLAYPFTQQGRGLNIHDNSDQDKAAIDAAFSKLFIGVSVLFILIAVVLVISAVTCAIFFLYCSRRIQNVSAALLQVQHMSSAKVQSVEGSLRKTRILIISTSGVIAVSFVARAAFQVLYGVAFTADYNTQQCSYQCQQGCQSDLFVLQV